jgi:hypothetical protein
MTRFWLLALGLFAVNAAAAPALVTWTAGEVQLALPARPTTPAPSAPFVLPEGGKLILSDGAAAVVLHEGTATRVRGPAVTTQSTLAAPTTGGDPGRSALAAVLERDVSFAKTGASRGDTVHLMRPIPGGAVLRMQAISWHCGECGAQEVQVYDFLRDQVVWTGRGSGTVAYVGPALAPGPYLIRVGGLESSVTVLPTDEANKVDLAVRAATVAADGLRAEGESDPAVWTSVTASVYMHAGLPSEALWAVDRALLASPSNEGLRDLRALYERHAGLPSR